jgi:hypothetical protein
MSVIVAATIGEAYRELEAEGLSWSAHCKPAIGYYQALHSWFIHDGQCYSVATAPQSVFSTWLEYAIPARWTDADRALNIAVEPKNAGAEESMLCRWYSLCNVMRGKNKVKVTIYGSAEEALQDNLQ